MYLTFNSRRRVGDLCLQHFLILTCLASFDSLHIFLAPQWDHVTWDYLRWCIAPCCSVWPSNLNNSVQCTIIYNYYSLSIFEIMKTYVIQLISKLIGRACAWSLGLVLLFDLVTHLLSCGSVRLLCHSYVLAHRCGLLLTSFCFPLSLQAVVSEQADAAAQRSSPNCDQASTQGSDARPENRTHQRRSSSSIRRQQVD